MGFLKLLANPWSILERPLVYRAVQLFPGYFLTQAYRRLLFRHLRAAPSETVLDVGCGTGNYVDYFPQQRYIGLDINPDYIEHATRIHGQAANATYVCLDLNKLKDANLNADYGFCLAVTHHLTDSELQDMIRNVLESVRSAFIIVDLCLPSIWSNPVGYLLVKLDRGKYGRPREKLIAVVEKVCRVKEVSTDFGFPYPAVGLTLVRTN